MHNTSVISTLLTWSSDMAALGGICSPERLRELPGCDPVTHWSVTGAGLSTPAQGFLPQPSAKSQLTAHQSYTHLCSYPFRTESSRKCNLFSWISPLCAIAFPFKKHYYVQRRNNDPNEMSCRRGNTDPAVSQIRMFVTPHSSELFFIVLCVIQAQNAKSGFMRES